MKIVNNTLEFMEKFNALKEILGLFNLEVLHIGNTSIPNMDSFGVVEALIVLNNFEDIIEIKKFLETEYDMIHENNVITFINEEYKIYCVTKEEQFYKEAISYKEYLINHPDEVIKYNQMMSKTPDYLLVFSSIAFTNEILLKIGLKKDLTYKKSAPDYLQSVLGITNSLKKYYGLKTSYETSYLVDDYLLDKPKHIILMVLDGLGKAIIDKNLKDSKFINQNLKADISTVFPPTTVAATTSIQVGMAPIETGWIGWHEYLPGYKDSVILFQNKLYKNGDVNPYGDINEFIKVRPFFEDINVPSYTIYPSFKEDGFKTFDEALDHALEIIKTNDESFIYFYWDEPDFSMHEFGTSDLKVKGLIASLDESLAHFSEMLDNDTLLIITADHGQVDVKPIYLKKFSELIEMLECAPSIEGRMASFNVKKEKAKEFVELFNQYFSDYFILYTKKDFMKNKFLGLLTPHPLAESILGDFLAVATNRYYFDTLNEETPDFVFKGHHAGMCKDELRVPLIIYKKD